MRPNVVEVIQTKFYIVLTTLFITFIVFPTMLVIFPPMILLRKFVSYLSKVMRPDLDKILSVMSTIVASDDVEINPKWGVLSHMHLNGPIEIELLKARFVNKIIGIKKVGNQLKNIEMKQFPYKWMGFIFWKWDEDFDISNHVKYYQSKEKTESKISMEQIKKIELELTFKPFPEKRSPWEMIIFRNVESESGTDETVIVFRFHHSLADGYSALKLVCFDVCDETSSEIIPQAYFPKKSWFEHFLSCLKNLKIPYDFAEMLVEVNDRNYWKSKNKCSNDWMATVSEKINMSDLKEVKDAFNSSLTAVILSGVTAAIRQAMLKKNGNVPKFIHTELASPKSGHPDKLRNHAIVLLVKLPVGEKDPIRRLKSIDTSLMKLKNSTLPLASSILTLLVGNLFYWIIKPLVLKSGLVAMSVASFPGPKAEMSCLGQKFINSNFTTGPLNENICLLLYTLTYNNYTQLRALAHKSIFGEQNDLEEIIKDWLHEFKELKCCAEGVV